MIKKLIDGLAKIETALASLILIILIGSTFFGVIMRYLFSAPFTWEEELQLACMVWISFLAAPVAFHTKSHVAIEIVVDMLPQKAQKIMSVVILALVYGILIYFLLHCFDFLNVMARTGRATPILKIPYTFVYSVAPVSLVLMLISFTYETVMQIKNGGNSAGKEVA